METFLVIFNLLLIGLLVFKEIYHSKQIEKIVKDLTDKIKAKDLTEYSLYKQFTETKREPSTTEPIKQDIQDFLNAYYYEKELERSLNEEQKQLTSQENADTR